jgi:hypothetical protein
VVASTPVPANTLPGSRTVVELARSCMSAAKWGHPLCSGGTGPMRIW